MEILHFFLLGVVKYLTRDFMVKLKEKDRIQMMARWSSFCTKSLNIKSIQPNYMLEHFKSFLGKDLKIVIQAAPFVFFPFMGMQERSLWSSLCQLGPYIFQTKITDMPIYLLQLENQIDNFLFHLIHTNAR